jgi:hypothetical protein
MRAAMPLRAAVLPLLLTASPSLGQDHNPHGSVFSDEDHDEHARTAVMVWVNTKSGNTSTLEAVGMGKQKAGAACCPNRVPHSKNHKGH